MDFIGQILFSVAVALCLGFVQYIGKLRKGGEAFSLAKFVRTGIVGLVIGVVAGFSGVEITEETWPLLAAANAGTVAAAEAILKPILRLVGYDASATPSVG